MLASDPFWGTSFGETGRYQGLDLEFVVRSDQHTLLDLVHDLFGELMLGSASPAPISRTCFAVGRTAVDGRDGYFLAVDGSVVLRTPALGIAFANLTFEINQRVIDATAGVRLHAAAVAGSAGAVVLPGEMGAGKSTLSAGLVAAGWTYLTDETVAFSTSEGKVRPYPKPLSLGSTPPGLADRWSPRADYLPILGSTGLVPPPVLGSAARADAAVAVVVLPRYLPDSPVSIERLSEADALAAVAAQTFDLGRQPGTLSRLAALLESTPVFRLTSGDLDAAVAAVTRISENPGAP